LDSDPPEAPTDLIAAGGNGRVSLTWTLSSWASGYNVHRSAASGGPCSVVAANVRYTYYEDAELTNGVTYFYVVRAVKAIGQSGDSNEASGTPRASDNQ
jgi:hypothetical protein